MGRPGLDVGLQLVLEAVRGRAAHDVVLQLAQRVSHCGLRRSSRSSSRPSWPFSSRSSSRARRTRRRPCAPVRPGPWPPWPAAPYGTAAVSVRLPRRPVRRPPAPRPRGPRRRVIARFAPQAQRAVVQRIGEAVHAGGQGRGRGLLGGPGQLLARLRVQTAQQRGVRDRPGQLLRIEGDLLPGEQHAQPDGEFGLLGASQEVASRDRDRDLAVGHHPYSRSRTQLRCGWPGTHIRKAPPASAGEWGSVLRGACSEERQVTW